MSSRNLNLAKLEGKCREWPANHVPTDRCKDDSKPCCERLEKARRSTLRDQDPLFFFGPTFIGLSG